MSDFVMSNSWRGQRLMMIWNREKIAVHFFKVAGTASQTASKKCKP